MISGEKNFCRKIDFQRPNVMSNKFKPAKKRKESLNILCCTGLDTLNHEGFKIA